MALYESLLSPVASLSSTNHLRLWPSVFLPAADIPRFVGEGNVDFGITGQDMVAEADVASLITEVLPLGFGKCKLQVQVPTRSTELKTVEDLVGRKVVTSFEVLAGKYFGDLDAKAGKKTLIEYVGGSVEAACALGLADGIGELPLSFFSLPLSSTLSVIAVMSSLANIIYFFLFLSSSRSSWFVFPLRPLSSPPATNDHFHHLESGETMRAAGLHPIATLLTSQAVLIRSNKPSANAALIEQVTSRIAGFIAAGKYCLCNYNIERKNLDKAVKITPGRRAPTVSPLDDIAWVAVSSMVEKAEVADVMDRLQVRRLLLLLLPLSGFGVAYAERVH